MLYTGYSTKKAKSLFFFAGHLIFQKKWSLRSPGLLFTPSLKNKKKILKKWALKKFLTFPQKKFFLHLAKWNFLALILKKFLYFLKNTFSYISGNGTLKKTSYISGGKFPRSKNKKNPSWKNLLHFWKWKRLVPSSKNFYISGGNFQNQTKITLSTTFLYFSKRLLLTFWHDWWWSSKIKKILYTPGWVF